MREMTTQSPVEQLRHYLQALAARRRLFIIVSAAVALLAVAGCFLIPVKYEAKSTVFIERNVIDNLLKGIAVTPSMEDRIKVLRYYMVSRDIVSRTLKRMELDVTARYRDADVFENLVKSCQKRTNINMKDKDLFFISLTDSNPYFARDYINTLISIYVEENLAQKREESFGASRFLSEQVGSYKQKLDEIDARIIEFRKKVGIFSDASEAAIIAQIARDQEELKNTRSKKNLLLASIGTIEQQLKMLRKTTAYGFSGEASGDYNSKIRQLQGKLHELLLTYNDRHPSVIKLKEQIEELKTRQQDNQETADPVIVDVGYNPSEDPIYVDLKMRLNFNQSELNVMTAKEYDLASRIAIAEKALRNYPEDQKVLNDLERERANYAEIYQQMLQRVGISEVSKDMEMADKSTTFRIVDPAILPNEPSGMSRLMLMFAGLCAGLAAGVAVVLLLDNLDNAIKDIRALKGLGVTVLAEVPLIVTEADRQRSRQRDKAAYAFAAICCGCICSLFIYDLLGLGFIDSLLSRLYSGTAYRSPYGA